MGWGWVLMRRGAGLHHRALSSGCTPHPCPPCAAYKHICWIMPEAQLWKLDFSFSRLWASRSEEGAQASLLGEAGGIWEAYLYLYTDLPKSSLGGHPCCTLPSGVPVVHFLSGSWPCGPPCLAWATLAEVGTCCTQPCHFLPLCCALSP